MTTTELADSLCKALLQGEQAVWPRGESPALAEVFIERATFHGIECLIHEHLRHLAGCPAAVRDALRQLATDRAIWELRSRQQLSTVLAALASAGVEALVYKGSALAYSLYANPVWRPRGDSDLLVEPEHLPAVSAVFAALGYEQYTDADEVVSYKQYFSLEPPEGGIHGIDLHWRLNNSELLSTLFGFRELRSRAVPLPALGPRALAIGAVDALVIACLHRGVHKLSAYTVNGKTYYTGDRLIWLQDIDLLVRRLDAAGLAEFYATAQGKGLAGICHESLALAASWLHTPLPPGWDEGLAAANTGAPDRYLSAGPFRRGWLDLGACRGVGAKVAFCARILFPSAAYMHNKYADSGWQWLPWLYLRRISGGLLQRFRLGRGCQ